MNPLNDYPALRKVLYIFQWLANLATGVLSIVFLNDNQEGVPQWFTVTVLVLAFVWTYAGLTAQQNVPSYQDVREGNAPPPPPERGAVNVGVGLLVAILFVVLLILFGVRIN